MGWLLILLLALPVLAQRKTGDLEPPPGGDLSRLREFEYDVRVNWDSLTCDLDTLFDRTDSNATHIGWLSDSVDSPYVPWYDGQFYRNTPFYSDGSIVTSEGDVYMSGGSDIYIQGGSGALYLSSLPDYQAVWGGETELYLKAGIGDGGHYFLNSDANTDILLRFQGTSSTGDLRWMEDGDHFDFADIVKTSSGRIADVSRVTSATYSIASSDHILYFDTDGNRIRATLPAGVQGTHYRCTNVGSSDSTLTLLTTGGEKITGVDSLVLYDAETYNFYYDATEGYW